jgi:hypothetical protein
MYVPEPRYMQLAVPGLLCLAVGLYGVEALWKKRPSAAMFQAAATRIQQQRQLPYWLIGIGVIASFIRPHVPGALNFVLWLFSSIKYIGVIYLLFSRERKKWGILALTIGLAAWSSIRHAMFFEVMLWGVFIAFYVALITRPSMKVKVSLLLLGTLGIIALQGMKMQYREMIREGNADNRAVVFTTMVGEELGLGDDEFLGEDAISSTVIRINQGWIISRIMDYVPDERPFAEGETVWMSLYATFVPRLLDPDKPTAAGRENYQTFTGFQLLGTSMGISILGEGYANFGTTGAWIFTLAYGACLAVGLSLLLSACEKWPTLILWLPLIFLYPVKAEADLIKILNHFVKGGLMTVGFFWLATNVFGWRM